MGRMKGFYFSLDALTASMVLMAVIAVLSSFTPEPGAGSEPYQLDHVETAPLQHVNDWNSSIDTDETVLQYIHRHHILGNISTARETCNSYFSFSREYALFFSDEAERQKVCGELSITADQDLVLNRILLPDRKINGTFRGPETATLVMIHE